MWYTEHWGKYKTAVMQRYTAHVLNMKHYPKHLPASVFLENGGVAIFFQDLSFPCTCLSLSHQEECMEWGPLYPRWHQPPPSFGANYGSRALWQTTQIESNKCPLSRNNFTLSSLEWIHIAAGTLVHKGILKVYFLKSGNESPRT